MTKFISTRGYGLTSGAPQSFEQVLLGGLAPDGGLYVPVDVPTFSKAEIADMAGQSYVEIAYRVMKPFVGECIPEADFRKMLDEVYASEIFDHEDVTPLTKLDDDLYAMELFRGPTLAFKDVALQLLGRLFDYVLEKRGQRITIVGATSGDTGSAAIEGCRICKNLDIFILHPKGRVSDVQRKQMTTIVADNVYNIALEGNFDDCQNIVKAMFADVDFRESVHLSAINSINWARIMAQVVYYFTTAIKLGAPEKEISFSVPTGNFGNVFAAHIARRMGLPIKDLIVASNRNDILTRFFESGQMKMEGVVPSNSPSMDIGISSNFERYLFELMDGDSVALKALMDGFKDTGAFEISPEKLAKAKTQFKAHRLDEQGTLETIKKCHADCGEVIDPHTAVGLAGALAYRNEIEGPIVTLACAHPAKFPDAVEAATGIHPALPERLSDLFTREEVVVPLPNDLETVQKFVKSHAQITRNS